MAGNMDSGRGAEVRVKTVCLRVLLMPPWGWALLAAGAQALPVSAVKRKASVICRRRKCWGLIATTQPYTGTVEW